MPVVSKPLTFLGIVTVAAAAYTYFGGQSDSGTVAKHAKVASKTAEKPSDFTDEDYNLSLHFDVPSPKSPLRNVFLPLLKNDNGAAPDPGAQVKDILKVPGTLASGDPNWIFTGFATVNGVKSGLLENRSTHHSEFVNEGASWKTSRIVAISSGSIVFDDLAGNHVAVMRFDPVLAAKAEAKAGPDLALKPLDPTPALQGPIGGGPDGPGGPSNPGVRRGRAGGPPPGSVMMMNGATVTIGN